MKLTNTDKATKDTWKLEHGRKIKDSFMNTVLRQFTLDRSNMKALIIDVQLGLIESGSI